MGAGCATYATPITTSNHIGDLHHLVRSPLWVIWLESGLVVTVFASKTGRYH